MDKNKLEILKKFECLDPNVLFNHFLSMDDLKWLIEQAEKVERLEEYIDHLEHERNLLYGRLKMICDLTIKGIK
jgi:signal recognition particle GTPase